MADEAFDLEEAIGRLEQEFRLRDVHRSGNIPRSEFAFALVRNGGMLDQIDALAQQFASQTQPGAVNYVGFMRHMKELAKLTAKEDETNLLPSPPPAVDSRPRVVAVPQTIDVVPSVNEIRDFAPSPEFFERVSGVAAEVARRSASPPQPPMSELTPSPQPAPLRLPAPQPVAQLRPQAQAPATLPYEAPQEISAVRHVDAVNLSRSSSFGNEAGKSVSLRTVFAVVDEDGDGRASSEDIGIVFALHGIGTSQEQIDALFDAFDEPTVNYTNFCTLVSRLPPDTIARVRRASNWSSAPTTMHHTTPHHRGTDEAIRRPLDLTSPSSSSPVALTGTAPKGQRHMPVIQSEPLAPVEHVQKSRAEAIDKRLRFERPTQSSHAKRQAAANPPPASNFLLREPASASKARVTAPSPAGKKQPAASTQRPASSAPDVHKISLVAKLPLADVQHHAESLLQAASGREAGGRSTRYPEQQQQLQQQQEEQHQQLQQEHQQHRAAQVAQAQSQAPPPLHGSAHSPAYTIASQTAAKFNGNASQLLHLCTNMDRFQSGELEIPRMQIALRAVAPSLSSSEVALLCEMSLSSSRMSTCNYVKLAGDLIIAEAELRENSGSPRAAQASSPPQRQPPPSQHPPQRCPQPATGPALGARPTNHVVGGKAATSHRDDLRSRSRSQSNSSAVDEASMSLEERVRRGREKMRLLIKQELLAAAQDDMNVILEYFAQIDPSQSGYADEKAFRRTVVDLFKAGGRQLSSWVMDRCVKTSRLPFEPSHATLAEMSEVERNARNTAKRCPAKLQSSMCDYRFLLADLGLVEY